LPLTDPGIVQAERKAEVATRRTLPKSLVPLTGLKLAKIFFLSLIKF